MSKTYKDSKSNQDFPRWARRLKKTDKKLMHKAMRRVPFGSGYKYMRLYGRKYGGYDLEVDSRYGMFWW